MPKPQKHVFVCTQNRGLDHPRGSCQQNNCGEVIVIDEFMHMLEFQQRELHGKYALTASGCVNNTRQKARLAQAGHE